MTSKKRAAGEGTVYQRPDGRWVAQVTLEAHPSTGRRRRKTVYGTTQGEALAKLKDVHRDIDAGLAVNVDTFTVGEHLEAWLSTLPGQVAESTAQLYRDFVRLHLTPQLGRTRLRRLSVTDVDRRWADMRAAKYSANTIRLARSTLRRALHQAEHDGLVPPTSPRCRHHRGSPTQRVEHSRSTRPRRYWRRQRGTASRPLSS